MLPSTLISNIVFKVYCCLLSWLVQKSLLGSDPGGYFRKYPTTVRHSTWKWTASPNPTETVPCKDVWATMFGPYLSIFHTLAFFPASEVIFHIPRQFQLQRSFLSNMSSIILQLVSPQDGSGSGNFSLGRVHFWCLSRGSVWSLLFDPSPHIFSPQVSSLMNSRRWNVNFVNSSLSTVSFFQHEKEKKGREFILMTLALPEFEGVIGQRLYRKEWLP